MYFAIIMAILALNPDPITHAKQLTHEKNYEKSVSILKEIKVLQPDKYNDFCFLAAVNYFALNDKVNAEIWINNYLNSFEPKVSRQANLIFLMEDDLRTWKANDLKDIGRDMRISQNRLETIQTDKPTQDIQKQIISKLDKLIEDKEKSDAQAKADAEAQANKGKGIGQPNGPANESRIENGITGPGKVDDKKLKQLAANWGSLPPAERQKAIQEITRELPAKYKPMIEEYFKALNQVK